jgi:hypothetical protein
MVFLTTHSPNKTQWVVGKWVVATNPAREMIWNNDFMLNFLIGKKNQVYFQLQSILYILIFLKVSFSFALCEIYL